MLPASTRTLSARLEYHATHHYVTGLPNSLLRQQRVSAAIAAARRSPQTKGEANRRHFALLCLNLHRFKAVNDAYGYAFGARVRLRRRQGYRVSAPLHAEAFTALVKRGATLATKFHDN